MSPLNMNSESSMTLREYFFSQLKPLSYFSDGGLIDNERGHGSSPIFAYPILANDFCYKEEANTIVFNIGNYADQDLSNLLKRIFVPLDEFSFDLVKTIKNEKTKLILKNEISNQDSTFFDLVYTFFRSVGIKPKYEGCWSKE